MTQLITRPCLHLLFGKRKLISPGAVKHRGLKELIVTVPKPAKFWLVFSPSHPFHASFLFTPAAPKVVLQPRGVNSRVGSFSRKERTGRLCPKGQLRTVVGSSLCSHGPDERGVDSLRGGHKKALGDFEQRPGKTINCGLIRSLREYNLNQTHGSGMTQVTCPSQRLSVGG
jgi:hypothetical protein